MPYTDQLSHLRILIVEDDFINKEFLNELLKPYTQHLFFACNGKEALDITLAKNTIIDVILMDIKMPIMDGFEATKLMRAHGIKTPVIAQTAYATDFDKMKINKAGFDGYLAKPIDESLLIQAILKVL